MSDTPDPDASTRPAAQADVLGGDARTDGRVDGPLPGGSAKPVGNAAEPPAGGRTGAPPQEGDARPGLDENQAGFLKDAEAARPRGG